MMASKDGSGDGQMSFAEKMMKKMGWTEGKGLGKDETGMKDFLKPKMKFNTKGMGFMGVDNKWVAHQEHFDDLLTSLNKGEKPDQKQEIASLTSESKLRGRTKFYSKMMRGKDLSNRSAKDLSSIIVPLAKKDAPIVEKPERAPLPSELDGTLKTMQVSSSDYFAKMMAQRRAKLSAASGSSSSSEVSPRRGDSGESDASTAEDKPSFGDSRKTSRKSSSVSSEDLQRELSPSESSGSERKKRKSKQDKQKKREAKGVIAIEDTVESVEPSDLEESGKRRKKSRKAREVVEEEEDSVVVAEVDADSEEAEPVKPKKSKKSKKQKAEDIGVVEDVVPIEVDEDSQDVRKDKSKKKSKKDRRKAEASEDETLDVAEVVEQKTKKRSRKSSDDSEVIEPKKKSKRSKAQEVVVIDEAEPPMPEQVEEQVVDKKKSKKSKKKLQTSSTSEEDSDAFSDDDTRLNIRIGTLRQIRGPSLKASKAPPVRELTDDQIQEVYRLWSSGSHTELMRRVHAGELPRWVATEKRHMERMTDGRTKTVNLSSLRDSLARRFKDTNLHEIWGYTNVAHLAV